MLTYSEDLPELEYLDGRAHRKVSPRRTHALVQKALLRILDECAGGRGEVGAEWRFNLGAVDGTATEFLPDVAFISHDRLGVLTAEQAEEPPLAPDIAVEIRSPSSSAGFIRRKIARYLETGSLVVLDVDPSRKTIAAHSPAGVRIYAGHERFAHDAAPWLVFEVALVFREIEKARPVSS